MRKIFFFSSIVTLGFAIHAQAASPIEVNLKNGKGEDVGMATLTEVAGGVGSCFGRTWICPPEKPRKSESSSPSGSGTISR